VTASAQLSTVPAPTEIFQSPAASLARKQTEVRQEASQALESITAHMQALAAQASELAALKDIFPAKVIDGLTQFANNTAGSIHIIKSAPPTLKR
jgi:hypothetical protein